MKTLLAMLLPVVLTAAPAMLETARKIPVVGEADVVVIGGTSAGVSTAIAAKEAGASVWLFTERPYLGEDLAGTLNLWAPADIPLENKLSQELWTDDTAIIPIASYKANATPDKLHADPTSDKLIDGLYSDPITQTVQYNTEQVKINAWLGETRHVEKVTAATFMRNREFDISEAHIAVSADGQKWSPAMPLERQTGDTGDSVHWSVHVGREVRYIAYTFTRRKDCRRMLIAQIGCTGKTGTRRVTPKPLKVKQTFDKALLDANVKYLTGAYVTNVLVDSQGAFAGVVIANRGGRQAIYAKTLIDATARGTAARLAGSQYPAFQPGERVFSRIVISADKPAHPSLQVEQLPGDYSTAVQWLTPGNQDKFLQGKAWKCTFKYSLNDDSYASYAAVEQFARNLTFTKRQLDAADSLIFAQDKPLKNAAHVFTCFHDKPWEAFDIGANVGRLAAADAQRHAVQGVPHVKPTSLQALSTLSSDIKICEQLNGLRPYEHADVTVESLSQGLPVLGEYDVVVAGGGTSGAPAAIGAARNGARTLVVEYLHGLGGLGTIGMIGKYWYGIKKGFTAEHDHGVAELGAAVHVVGKREWWRREISKAGGEIWFGAMACGTLLEGKCVKGIVVATPYGRGVILAQNVIDGTGNADIAALAGAETEFLNDSEIALQGAGLSPRPLGKSYVNTDWGYVNDSDPLDSWLFSVRGRLGAGDSWDISPMVETRERRRVKGAIVVSPLDVVRERTFPDTIAQGQSDFDSHGPSVADICYVSEATGKKLYNINIPYRAILPEKLDGLAVVGIAASAHRDAMPIMRMQSDVQNTGYAAGYAAALSVKSGKTLRNIDVKVLQRHLVDIGVIPQEALEWKDNLTVDPERWNLAVQHAGDGYQDAPILLSEPERAVPALQQAYKSEAHPIRKLCYAHLLGILGDATGVDTLVQQLSEPSAKPVINTEGKTAYGRRMGEREALLVGLGRTRSPKAVGVLLREIAKITGGSSTAQVRAISLACEALQSPELAPALAAALKRPKCSGWARSGDAPLEPVKDLHGTPEFVRCLRELNLARALLACGDVDGLARGIFEDYARDSRGILALHAHQVLEKYRKK